LTSEERNKKDMEKVTKILQERKDGIILSFWISTVKTREAIFKLPSSKQKSFFPRPLPILNSFS